MDGMTGPAVPVPAGDARGELLEQPVAVGDHVPVTAFADEHACELMKFHAPHPVMLEYHHQKPVFLQDRLYGRIVYGPSLWLCGNCHDAIHAWLYFLLGEHREPVHVGYSAKREAEATYAWYCSELERLGPDHLGGA